MNESGNSCTSNRSLPPSFFITDTADCRLFIYINTVSSAMNITQKKNCGMINMRWTGEDVGGTGRRLFRSTCRNLRKSRKPSFGIVDSWVNQNWGCACRATPSLLISLNGSQLRIWRIDCFRQWCLTMCFTTTTTTSGAAPVLSRPHGVNFAPHKHCNICLYPLVPHSA
jgi:hypothetical protein